MILEKNNLQTAQEWTKSYIELIALYVHPKNSNHLRSHLRAIMALDHSRLGLENKFLENKSGRIFCVRQVYFTKSCQQIWVRVNQPFIPFIHHIWGETVLWGTVFIIQTLDRKQYFTILQYKMHSFIQDDGSTLGLSAKPLSDRDDRRIFLSLKFSTPRFFLASIFLAGLVLVELFLGIKKNLKICGSTRVSRPCIS